MPATGQSGSSGARFDVGIPRIEADVPFEDIDPETSLTSEWLVEGDEFLSSVETPKEMGAETTDSGSLTFFAEIGGGFPPGDYSFQLKLAGEVVADGAFMTGSGDGIGPVVVTDRVDDDTAAPIGATGGFAVGEGPIYAAFRAPSPGGDGTVKSEWTVQGVSVAGGSFSASEARGVPGNPLSWAWDSLEWQGGLPPGHYNVTLTPALGGERTVSFVIGDGKGVGTIVFGTGVDGTLVTGVDDTFPDDVERVVVGYDVVGLPADTEVREVWEDPDGTVTGRNFTLEEASDSDPYEPLVSQVTSLTSQDWEVGTHSFEIIVDGEPARRASFEVVSS